MNQIANAIIELAKEVRSLTRAFTRSKSQENAISDLTKGLHGMECRIMSAISDFSEKVSTAFDEIGASVDGVVSDVKALKAKIDELQNSPGAITPEDQALLDDVQSKVTTLADKVKALDAETENAPTPA